MKVQNDVRVTIRVDKSLKERAEGLFDRLGMNMSTALNVFLRKAVDEEAIPFPISIKNTAFGAGHTPEDISAAFTAAVRREIAEYETKGFPVARYDSLKKKSYLEFSDGTREYVNK